MQIGYGRISTRELKIDLQKDALEAVGCEKFFFDVVSGAKTARPQMGILRLYNSLMPTVYIILYQVGWLGPARSCL